MANKKSSRKIHSKITKSNFNSKSIITLFLFIAISIVVVLFAFYVSNSKYDIRPKATSGSSPIFGQALSLDGSSYINVINSNNLNPTLGFTIEAWIKPNEPVFTGRIINRSSSAQNSYTLFASSEIIYPDQGYLLNYYFSVENSGNNCAFYTVQNQFTLPMSEVGNITTWHHVAGVVKENGDMQIYVDGHKSTMNSNTISGTCSRDLSVQIGARKFDNGEADGLFNGLLDEVRISNIARYEDEFNPGLIPFTPDSNDLILYHFDGDLNNAANSNYFGEAQGVVSFVPSDIVNLEPTFTPIPMPTPITFSNIRTGKSCNEICTGHTYQCVSIGTDPGATNSLYMKLGKNSSCTNVSGSCLTKMGKSSPQKTCSGNQTQWTNCHCQL
jgi:hypothetical protein